MKCGLKDHIALKVFLGLCVAVFLICAVRLWDYPVRSKQEYYFQESVQKFREQKNRSLKQVSPLEKGWAFNGAQGQIHHAQTVECPGAIGVRVTIHMEYDILGFDDDGFAQVVYIKGYSYVKMDGWFEMLYAVSDRSLCVKIDPESGSTYLEGNTGGGGSSWKRTIGEKRSKITIWREYDKETESLFNIELQSSFEVQAGAPPIEICKIFPLKLKKMKIHP